MEMEMEMDNLREVELNDEKYLWSQPNYAREDEEIIPHFHYNDWMKNKPSIYIETETIYKQYDSKISQLSRKRVKNDWSSNWLPSIIGILVPIIIPAGQMFLFNYLWGHLIAPVDKETCKCSCFDNLMKAPYETGTSGYKHVYFNYQYPTLKLWLLMVIFIFLAYESFKRLTYLWLIGYLRTPFALMFLSSIHSHYYGLWAQFNYVNDEWYELWAHQIIFSISELGASLIIVYFLDSRQKLVQVPLLILTTISFSHVLASSWDQFVQNVIIDSFKYGNLHKVARDCFLMTTDLIQLLIALQQLRICARSKGLTLFTLITRGNNLAYVLITYLIFAFSIYLFPQD